MFKLFDKDYFPSRPGEYIHKRDEIEKINPIFKYAQQSNQAHPAIKKDAIKSEEGKKVENKL